MRPRKGLGQHFLTHPLLLDRIAGATGVQAGDVVLEIGPGKGSLTRSLLNKGAMVVAIERDERLIETLTQQFAGEQFVLAAGDALEMDWHALVVPWVAQDRRWIVAGNIPYNITTPLFAKALTPPLAASVTFLVQKEVADRVVAPAGSEHYGALSVGIQAAATAKRLFTVGKGVFTPPPKVDSAVLHLVPRADPLIAPEDILGFRKLVTSLFSYRRKRMLKAMREATGMEAAAVEELLHRAGIDVDQRPETVDVERFVRLFAAMK